MSNAELIKLRELAKTEKLKELNFYDKNGEFAADNPKKVHTVEFKFHNGEVVTLSKNQYRWAADIKFTLGEKE